jgi:hypothetical protein
VNKKHSNKVSQEEVENGSIDRFVEKDIPVSIYSLLH